MAQSNKGVGSQGPKIFGLRQALVRTLTRLAFSFPTNNTSDPASINGRGVKSVKYISTGLYTVTLQDYWAVVMSAKVHLSLATPDKKKAQFVGQPSLSGGLTFQIQILDTDSGSAADIAAAAGNVVNVLLLLSNSSFGNS